MNILASNKLVTPCYFRADGVFCVEGYLYYSVPKKPNTFDPPKEPLATPGDFPLVAEVEPVAYERVRVEGESVTCSCCEGRGVILTDYGREMLTFFDTFLRPKIHETCADYIDDHLPNL